MDKKEFLPKLKLGDLRSDETNEKDTVDFWVNVPEYEEGYILTSRVAGV